MSPPFGVSGKHLSVFRGGFSTLLPSILQSADRSYFLGGRGGWGVLVFAGAFEVLGHIGPFCKEGLVGLFYCRGSLEAVRALFCLAQGGFRRVLVFVFSPLCSPRASKLVARRSPSL